MSLQQLEDGFIPRVDRGSCHTTTHHRSRRQIPTLHLHVVSLGVISCQLEIAAEQGSKCTIYRSIVLQFSAYAIINLFNL